MRRPTRGRRGYGLVEMTIAIVLAVSAMALLAQSVAWLAAERRGAERRQRALQEAANLMERLAARPWDELTPDLARSLELTRATKAVLGDGRLDVAIGPALADPTAKRVAVAIAWGERTAPVRLVAWVHRRSSGGPVP